MVPTRCLISMGGDHRLVVIEQFFTTFIIFRSSEVSIPQPLVDARFHRVGDIGGFTLDHPQRKTVDKQQNIRDDVLVDAFHLERVGTQELVVVLG